MSTSRRYPLLALLSLTPALLVIAQQSPSPHLIKHSHGDCLSAPCYSSINIPFDGEGEPAPTNLGPGYWGRQDEIMTSIAFEDIPSGYVVQILRIRGNLISMIHGPVAHGDNAGVLWSLQTSGSLGDNSPTNMEYGTNGCFVYSQLAIGDMPVAPLQFDTDLSKENVILPDGLMWSKEAVFLNDTGQSVHAEATFIVTYKFVKGEK